MTYQLSSQFFFLLISFLIFFFDSLKPKFLKSLTLVVHCLVYSLKKGL